MVLRFVGLLLALAAVAFFWAWRPPFEKHQLQLSFAGGVPAVGLEVTWIADGGRMGRAVEAFPGTYTVHADMVAVEVLGETVVDTLFNWKRVPAAETVQAPESATIRFVDPGGQPISGLPVMLLPKALGQEFADRQGLLERRAQGAVHGFLSKAHSSHFRMALNQWHSDSEGREPGATGWAEDSEGGRLWILEGGVVIGEAQAWWPAGVDQLYARTDSDGLARWEELPEDWTGLAFVGTSILPSEWFALDGNDEVATGERDRPAAPWFSDREGASPAVLCTLDLSVRNEYEASLVPTGDLEVVVKRDASLHLGQVFLYRVLDEGTLGAGRLKPIGWRKYTASGPETSMVFASLPAGTYLATVDWDESPPNERRVLWFSDSLAVASGVRSALVLEDPLSRSVTDVEFAWSSSGGEPLDQRDLVGTFDLELTFVPEGGGAEIAHLLDLLAEWREFPAASRADSPEAEHRADLRLIGLPEGRWSLRPLDLPQRGIQAPAWQLDPAFAGVQGEVGSPARIVIPVIPR